MSPEFSNGNGHSAVERMAENAWLRFVSRWAMVIAAALLPMMGGLIGYFGNRVLTEIDGMALQLAQTSTRVEVLQQRIEDSRSVRDQQMLSFKGTLDDHENRLRAIERKKVP